MAATYEKARVGDIDIHYRGSARSAARMVGARYGSHAAPRGPRTTNPVQSVGLVRIYRSRSIDFTVMVSTLPERSTSSGMSTPASPVFHILV